MDQNKEEIGLLSDLQIAGGETFPKIIGLEVSVEKEKKIVPEHYVNLISNRVTTLNSRKSNLLFRERHADDLFLVKDFLDKQILDADGAKIVRVNDLKLARFNEDVRLIAADVGLTGLLRRMKLLSVIKPLILFFGKPCEDHLISWNFVEPISGSHPKVRLTVPQSKLNKLHPADIAEILVSLSPPERAAVVESLGEEKAAEALHDIEPELSLEILDDLSPKKAASILEEMNPDDAADILGELPKEKVDEILSDISEQEAADLKKLLTHDEDTAGGLMTTDFISLRETMTVQETIEYLRETAPDAETIYYLFVIDHDNRLSGVVSLRELIISQPSLHLAEIMTTKIVKVSANAKKQEVAELIAKYDLLALPVLDESQQLVGIITVDDVVDVLIPHHWKRRS